MGFETWYNLEIERIFSAPIVKGRFGILSYAMGQAKDPQGLVIECGVHEGKTINFLAALVLSVVYGFDSFQGLPEDWIETHPKGTFDLAEVFPDMAENVCLYPGWFKDTLPRFVAKKAPFTIRLLHVDCELYSSTVDVLENLGPFLVSGSVICFDELIHYPEHKEHEIKAWHEYCVKTGIQATPIARTGYQQVAYIIDKAGTIKTPEN